MEVAHPLRIHTHIGRDVLVFSSVFLSLLQYEVLSGISGEWFYLDHLLCDLPGLVNIQGNLGIPHHRIKSSALAQAGGRERGEKEHIQGRDFINVPTKGLTNSAAQRCECK